MLLSTTQLAQILNCSSQKVRRLFRHLNIPHQIIKGNLYLDTTIKHPFQLSLHILSKHTDLLPIYTIQQIATLFNKDKKTVRQLLYELDIPIQGSNKSYIYLFHFYQLKVNLRKKY